MSWRRLDKLSVWEAPGAEGGTRGTVNQKIEPAPGDPTFIKTIRLGGYIFTPEVTPA